jgi:hypothetical protein
VLMFQAWNAEQAAQPKVQQDVRPLIAAAG